MHCPTLAELPPPPDGRTGWPWTVETPRLPATRPDGTPWQRISIVTPSYNQGQFIEETIRSILLQGYPDLEYIVIDGGSTDQSVEIIKKYERWIIYWVSQKDRGQVHAINKGLAKATGEIFNWINSDDVLQIGALKCIARVYRGDMVAASVLTGFTGQTLRIGENRNLSFKKFLFGRSEFHKEGLWFPRDKFVVTGIDERLDYAFDWDLVVRYLQKFNAVTYLPEIVAYYRLHDKSKTVSQHHLFYNKEKLLIRALLMNSSANVQQRALCRKAQHQANWMRHLTEWRQSPRLTKGRTLRRMLWLGLHKPHWRINRFWLGALRRSLKS